MRTHGHHEQHEQLELAQRVTATGSAPVRVRPTADEELEATFLRAAAAWARWRERQRWGAH